MILANMHSNYRCEL